MSVFIEKGISDLSRSLKNGSIEWKNLYNEVCEKTQKYQKYNVWASFDESILLSHYIINRTVANKKKINELPLFGIPVGIKDVVNTIDYPTQMGSVIWKDFEPGNDARIVYEIERHGGIIAGKTVTAEFAVHALNETLNPYDIERTPGTSSSGSAVAVALGIVPAAIGTQTAGSIIRPSSFCGVFGVVPSFGLIPRTGVLKTTDSLDTMGFITSRVDNIRVFFNSLIVKGQDYPFAYKAFSEMDRQKRGHRKWKICFTKTYVWDNAEEYVKKAINEFVANLTMDNEIDIVEEDINSIIYGAHETHEVIYDKSLSYYFTNEHHNSFRISEVMNSMIDHGERITCKEYLDAIERQNQMYYKMDKFMSQYDAIISISTSSVAPCRNEKEKRDPSLIWTLLHLPSINIPQFLEEDSGLPFGVQICGRRFNDGLLMEFVEYLANKGMIPKKIQEPKDEW